MDINKEEVGRRFRRSMSSYDDNARVQKMVVERLEGMIVAAVGGVPRKVLEIGCGTGLLTTRLARDFSRDVLYLNDLVADLCDHAARVNRVAADHCLPGDIEKLELPRGFDLVASASTFQWFSEPGRTLGKLAGCLETGGVLAFSTFGKDNLREVRSVAGGGLYYRGKEEMEGLLEPYFEIERVAEEFHALEFDSPLGVLQHLKRTGVNVSGKPGIWTKGRVEAFVDGYNARFGVEGKVTLTYHPLYFTCRKR